MNIKCKIEVLCCFSLLCRNSNRHYETYDRQCFEKERVFGDPQNNGQNIVYDRYYIRCL